MYSVSNRLSEYTYQKTLLHTPLLLAFKIVESLQCILKHTKAVCCFKGILARPKNIFLGTLLSRFFEYRGPTSSVYVSTLKDLALLVCCQSNTSFSEW